MVKQIILNSSDGDLAEGERQLLTDSYEIVADILMSTLDTDRNGKMEENEFTLLAIRVLKWTDEERRSRLPRMFRDTDESAMVHIDAFFAAMKMWLSFQLPPAGV